MDCLQQYLKESLLRDLSGKVTLRGCVGCMKQDSTCSPSCWDKRMDTGRSTAAVGNGKFDKINGKSSYVLIYRSLSIRYFCTWWWTCEGKLWVN